MSELKVDEEELSTVAMYAKNVIEHIQKDIDLLLNKDKDIFLRYFAYIRLFPLSEMHRCLLENVKISFLFGFNANSDILQTSEAKENGWVAGSIEGNSFFTNDEITKKKEDKCYTITLEQF